MITMSAARRLCGLAVLAPVVPALPPIEAAEHAQLASVRAPTYEQQQGKINAWTVGDAAGLIEGADTGHLHHRARWRVDDGTNVAVLPIVRLGTTERLYLRGADLAIVNSGACSLLAQAERIECLEKLSRNIAPPAVSPSSD
jgi:hypothetical protein